MLNQPNSIKTKLADRASRPQTVASVFGGILQTFGINVSCTDIVNNWAKIVGTDISNISKVLSVKNTKNKKVNVVLCPLNPALALELSYKLEECTNKINAYYGKNIVNKIIIKK